MLKGKELAIKVAEKLGDGDSAYWFQYDLGKDDEEGFNEYLHNKAAEIFFDPNTDVSVKIYRHVYRKGDSFQIDFYANPSPEKILNV